MRSLDGALDLPEADPPRLALRLTYEPGHRAHLEWAFRYGATNGGVLTPLANEDPDPMRDRAAERVLVDRLHEVAAVETFAPLWQVVAKARRLVPELRLHGIRTVDFTTDVLPALREIPDLEVEVIGDEPDYSEAVEAPLIQVSATDAAARPDGTGGGGAGGTASATDWFDLGVAVTVGGEDVPFAPLIAALARATSS